MPTPTKNIYLATSWQNAHYESLRKALQDAGHHVYDFKDPKYAFSYDDVHPDPELLKRSIGWGNASVIHALHQPVVRTAWLRDFRHIRAADRLVLLLPAGASAHMEAGIAYGRSIPVAIYSPRGVIHPKPDLMWFPMRDRFYQTVPELLAWLEGVAWLEGGIDG